MKQLLTSAGFAAMLLLCAVFCQAQIKLTNPIGIISLDTTATYDTIQVALLVSDTSLIDNGSVFKINGYEVRKKKCCVNGNETSLSFPQTSTFVYRPIPFYEHVKYIGWPLVLNEEIKGLIIWQAVPVK